jgi:hypothetical protein
LQTGKRYESEIIGANETINTTNKESKKYYVFNYGHLAVFLERRWRCAAHSILLPATPNTIAKKALI